jgi:hypothetical protein
MIKIKKISKKVNPVYKEAVCHALGILFIQDYLAVASLIKGTELEKFFETWVRKIFLKLPSKEKKVIWRNALVTLFTFREKQKMGM